MVLLLVGQLSICAIIIALRWRLASLCNMYYVQHWIMLSQCLLVLMLVIHNSVFGGVWKFSCVIQDAERILNVLRRAFRCRTWWHVYDSRKAFRVLQLWWGIIRNKSVQYLNTKVAFYLRGMILSHIDAVCTFL
jgi:hypothetical protein